MYAIVKKNQHYLYLPKSGNTMMVDQLLNRKAHWEHIYETKSQTDMSWFQRLPSTSLDFVWKFNLPANARIIDIGGGDSLFVDHLLDMGYTDVTVLDISEAAILRAKDRLGKRGDIVKWIVADVLDFQPERQYDFWHDRAAFHFLTDDSEVASYLSRAYNAIRTGGLFILGTFSTDGPQKCSGLPVRQYSEQSLAAALSNSFARIITLTVDHETPFSTVQNFVFGSFRRLG